MKKNKKKISRETKKNHGKKKIEDNQKLETEPEAGKMFQLNAHYFLFVLIIFVLIGCYNIIEPYLHPVILAMILVSIFTPVHKKIEILFRGRKNIAAFFSCVLLTLVVVVPLILIFFMLIQQGIHSFDSIYDWFSEGKYTKMVENLKSTGIVQWLTGNIDTIQKVFPDIDINNIKINETLMKISSSTGKMFINQGGHLVGNITSIIGKFFLMIFTFFFFIRDEQKILKMVLHLIPLSMTQEERIIAKIKQVSQSVFLGTIVTAIAQGAAGGIAFWISGLPGFFWGMVMAFASLIPLIGTSLIWIPASCYLCITGSWGYGIFLAIWCIVVVGMIDNIIRPLFMQGSADMSTLVIFFAILGGVNYFGLLGLLYGPIIFGLAIVLLYIYNLEFESFLNSQDNR